MSIAARGDSGWSFCEIPARRAAAVIMLEVFLEGWEYFLKADLYILVLAAVFQAWWLSHRTRRASEIFLGNLLAPTLYSFFEGFIEGPTFWSAPHHQVYWGLALLLALLQALQALNHAAIRKILVVLENLVLRPNSLRGLRDLRKPKPASAPDDLVGISGADPRIC